MSTTPRSENATKRTYRPRRLPVIVVVVVFFLALIGGLGAWIAIQANEIKTELLASINLVPQLKTSLLDGEDERAIELAEQLGLHTSRAREASSDPIWTLAASLPWIGANLSATSEISRSADDMAETAILPLASVYSSVQWEDLMPGEGQNLTSIRDAAPKITTAAQAVQITRERLEGIDEAPLIEELASPLSTMKQQLNQLSGALDGTASAAKLAAPMLGDGSPRNYLLIIQNTAEARATGGIPGALAVLGLGNGTMTLTEQTSAGDLGVFSPPIPTEPEQSQIYTNRMGKFMQDVNLTPDFPSSARTAQSMWETRTGQKLDGVISIDPVVLSYVLDATGPITVTDPSLLALSDLGLPSELGASDVVKVLLSDVYAQIEQPNLQDAYFAGVAQEVFSAISTRKTDARMVVEAMGKGVEEGRLLIWSGNASEQDEIAKYPISGSIAGPSVLPAQFGAYFNDGTGAKMDYYVKRTVQLIKECPRDGYEETTLRITSTNTAPKDAANSLPPYVTGDAQFGVPAGSVQTNIVAYGPVQANVETAKLDGVRTDFAPYIHSNRPVGVKALRLSPGESRTVDFTFGKIVQHTEPNLVVTPTVQAVKDVILPTVIASCG